MTHNNFRTIHSISYFVAAAGVLGEACAESPQDTQIKDVERGKDDQTPNATHLCVMILTDGAAYIGKYLQTNPAMGEREARHLAYGDAERQALEDIK